jgi:hypothetical protein
MSEPRYHSKPSYIIVTRNPSNNKVLVMLDEDAEYAMEFATYPEAQSAAEVLSVLRAWGHQILEVE